jgi:hypothetical protein
MYGRQDKKLKAEWEEKLRVQEMREREIQAKLSREHAQLQLLSILDHQGNAAVKQQ